LIEEKGDSYKRKGIVPSRRGFSQGKGCFKRKVNASGGRRLFQEKGKLLREKGDYFERKVIVSGGRVLHVKLQ
jgi:hypothetical protein